MTHSNERRIGESAIECYQTMTALYQSGFLDGICVNDAAEFETWVGMTREHFHEAHAHALHALAATYRAEGRWTEVIALARTAVMQDILQEPMYRMLMEAHALLGDRASALRQYETLRATLERELRGRAARRNRATASRHSGWPPETRPTRPLRIASAGAEPTDQHPAPFIGRDSDLAALDDIGLRGAG